MNRTKLFPLVALLSLATSVTQAFADSGENRDGAPVPTSTMSRAEVLALAAPEPTDRLGAPTAVSSLARSEVIADLEIWRTSGLAAAERGEAVDTFDARYLAAVARYRAMRDAPAFADQVARIARQRGERQLIAGR
jgi:hypothetical protein